MDSDQVRVAIRSFAAGLYSQVLSESTHADNLKNQIMSPVSLYAALSLALAGSAGDTRDELLRVMHLTSSEHDETLHKSIGHTLTAMLTFNRIATVSLGNGVFIRQSAQIHDSYKSIVDEFYKAKAQNVDFRNNPEGARKHINKSVNDQVRGKILQLIPRGFVDSDTRMILVNTLYFVGKWAKPFDYGSTEWEDFFMLNGKTNYILTMCQEESYEWLNLPELDAELIKLDFDQHRCGWKMVIVLPNKREGLPDLLKQLENPDRCASLLKATGTRQRMHLWLPRFKLSSNINWDTSETLKNMGLTSMFDEIKADFSGMSDEPSLVSGVKHKAILEVDEKGAVVAVSTGVFMIDSCCRLSDGLKQFRVDHPFSVFLMDKHGTPMFMGHVMDPESL